MLEVDVAAVLPASGEQLCEVRAASAQDAAVGGEPLPVDGKRHVRILRTLQHPATRETTHEQVDHGNHYIMTASVSQPLFL